MKLLFRRIPLKHLTSLTLAASQPSNNTHLNLKTCIDARIIKTGFDPNTSRSNYQVRNLIESGQLSEARQLFDQMPHKNTVSTNMMVLGYVKEGNLSIARQLFDSMVDRTAVTYTILIGGYSRSDQFREAFELFVDMYRGDIRPDYVTFATLLSGCNDPPGGEGIISTSFPCC